MTQIPGALGLTTQQVDDLLRTAGRAPSLHNSQPWQFRVSPRSIELLADPARTLPVADPDGREQRLACGAALFNLRLALHGYGIRPTVTVLPDRARPELLAVIRHGGARNLRRSRRGCCRPSRCGGPTGTRSAPRRWRRPRSTPCGGPHSTKGPGCTSSMTRISERPCTRWCCGLTAGRRPIRTSGPSCDAWSTRPAEQRDGVSAEAGGPMPEPYDRWVMRDFTGGTGRPRLPGKDFEEEPLIAVLTSHLSGTTAEVQVGQALQRVLLAATGAGSPHHFCRRSWRFRKPGRSCVA